MPATIRSKLFHEWHVRFVNQSLKLQLGNKMKGRRSTYQPQELEMHRDRIVKGRTCSIRGVRDDKRILSQYRSCSIPQSTLSILLYLLLVMLEAYSEKCLAIILTSLRSVNHGPCSITTRPVALNSVDIFN
jgi:hypothetical protein